MTEAERRMPDYTRRIRAQLVRSGMGSEDIMMRMTGCPNGCARPYMTELAFVGDGKDTYQLWLGGSPVLTRTAWPYMAKMNDKDLEYTVRPILKISRSRGSSLRLSVISVTVWEPRLLRSTPPPPKCN